MKSASLIFLQFYSCFHITEDNRHTLFTDKMEFHVLELPKLPKELKEDSSDILLWAKFIDAERKEEFDMLAAKNQYIDSAYRQLQVVSQSKEKRLEYEARQKAIWDYNQGMREAREQGIEQGIEMAAQKFLAAGYPEETVSELTNILMNEIKQNN